MKEVVAVFIGIGIWAIAVILDNTKCDIHNVVFYLLGACSMAVPLLIMAK